MFNKSAFVCSAYQKDEENLVLARKYCQYVLKQERLPFAPHLLFPQFLDENTPKERQFGIELGEAFMNRCDEMWVFVRNGILSPGMTEEIYYAYNFFWGNVFYFDATDASNIIELKHIPTNTGIKRYGIPIQSQLLAPNSFSNKAKTKLDDIAAALKSGKKYEDLQDELESFLGPVDDTQDDLEANSEWENNYRKNRE